MICVIHFTLTLKGGDEDGWGVRWERGRLWEWEAPARGRRQGEEEAGGWSLEGGKSEERKKTRLGFERERERELLG